MKILYVTTISDTVNGFLIPHIEMLLDKGHAVDVACNVQMKIHPDLIHRGTKIFNLDFQRTPFAKRNYRAYKTMLNILNAGEYDVVHVHTPVAAALTRLACRKYKKMKVIYTAHGFHFYTGAPVPNWLLYFPAEKWLARYTDVLITINYEDYVRAEKFLRAKKVVYISGVGVDTADFSDVILDRGTKKKELGLPEKAYTVLSVGELNKNKNHETVIRALAELKNPNIYYLICGNGPLEKYLLNLSRELDIEKQVLLLGHRKDIAEICKAGDVFVFPSHREGLPVSVMEAMASGLPVICSEIRGNKDLIVEEKGGFLAKNNSIDEYRHYIAMLMDNPLLSKKFGDFNKEKIKEFSIKDVLKKLQQVYSGVGN